MFVNLWNGWWDDPEEGVFSDVNTGEAMPGDGFAPWFPGEPNGHRAENCAILWANRDSWNDQPCDSPLCGLCYLEEAPNFNIRGWCFVAVNDDNDVAVAVVVAAATVPAPVAFADKVFVVVVVGAAATTTTIITTIAAAAAAAICFFESISIFVCGVLTTFAVIILASALSRNFYTFSFLTLDC